MIQSAVVPVAGHGTRLLPATKSQPKEMLPVARKPIVQYVVEELVSKPLERKISELKSIEEIKTTSRPGISTMTIKQHPAPTATIDQEWDKVRA